MGIDTSRVFGYRQVPADIRRIFETNASIDLEADVTFRENAGAKKWGSRYGDEANCLVDDRRAKPV
jgi:hypothetical protein